jgi:hypothetical protein
LIWEIWAIWEKNKKLDNLRDLGGLKGRRTILQGRNRSDREILRAGGKITRPARRNFLKKHANSYIFNGIQLAVHGSEPGDFRKRNEPEVLKALPNTLLELAVPAKQAGTKLMPAPAQGHSRFDY